MIKFIKTIFSDNRKKLKDFRETSHLRNYQKISAVRYLNSSLENAKLCEEQYREGKTVLETAPLIVFLTLTSFCNYKIPCLICDRNVRPESADSQLSKDVLDAALPILRTARVVYLHCGGEPMFSNQFDNAIKLIDLPTLIAFSTNGMLLTKKRANLFLERKNVAHITFSMDAATESMFQIMRPSGKFKTVVNNISYLIEQRNSLGLDKPKIALNMTICKDNLPDVPKLIDLAVNIGAEEVMYNHLNIGLDFTLNTAEGETWRYNEQTDFEDLDSHDEIILETYEKAKAKANGIKMGFRGAPFIGSRTRGIDKKVVTDLIPILRPIDSFPVSPFHKDANNCRPSCVTPWREVVIQPNGDIRPCFHHDIDRYKIGNILESDFMEIWNSSIMVNMREEALNNSFAKMCYASEPCYFRGKK